MRETEGFDLQEMLLVVDCCVLPDTRIAVEERHPNWVVCVSVCLFVNQMLCFDRHLVFLTDMIFKVVGFLRSQSTANGVSEEVLGQTRLQLRMGTEAYEILQFGWTTRQPAQLAVLRIMELCC